ncbi:hypothetical protein [Terriglobus roseus]|nr:hypothetical protein [Terriglobus roseus]
MKMLTLSAPDRLLAIANYLYIGAGALALALTLAIVILGNAVGRRKQAELDAYQAGANARIADADARGAEAYAAAERANELAQRAALDKAKIENDNLQLREKIEQEQEARLAIERKIAPRYMTVSEMGYVWGIEQIAGAEPLDIIFYNDDPEVRFLAGNISVALQHWSPSLFGVAGGSLHGVVIYYEMGNTASKQRAEVISAALRRASAMDLIGPLAASHQFFESSVPDLGGPAPHAAIRIDVGYK